MVPAMEKVNTRVWCFLPPHFRFNQDSHWHRGGLKTRPYASEDPANDKMCASVCRGLQSSADDDPRHGEPYGTSAAEPLADEEVAKAPEQTAEIVARRDQTRQGVVRVLKLPWPVLVLEDAAEDALVVAIENECTEAAGCDCRLQLLPTAKPGPHSPWRVWFAPFILAV